jgi:hypothetical protein
MEGSAEWSLGSEVLGAFLRLRRKNRAFRSNLFCGFAAKKDFRCNPLRTGYLPGCRG